MKLDDEQNSPAAAAVAMENNVAEGQPEPTAGNKYPTLLDEAMPMIWRECVRRYFRQHHTLRGLFISTILYRDLSTAVSSLVYPFAKLVRKARDQSTLPSQINEPNRSWSFPAWCGHDAQEASDPENLLHVPDIIMNEYKNKRLDVRRLNEGRGLSFYQVYDQFKNQIEELKRLKIVDDYDWGVVEKLKEIEDRVGKFVCVWLVASDLLLSDNTRN